MENTIIILTRKESEEMLDMLPLSGCTKLMAVAHLDDETLYGGIWKLGKSLRLVKCNAVGWSIICFGTGCLTDGIRFIGQTAGTIFSIKLQENIVWIWLCCTNLQCRRKMCYNPNDYGVMYIGRKMIWVKIH